MSQALVDAIAAYKATNFAFSKQRALAEDRLIEIALQEGVTTGGKYASISWLSGQVGVLRHDIEMRYRLTSALPSSEALFDALDRGKPKKHIHDALIKARALMRQRRIPLKDAIDEVLEGRRDTDPKVFWKSIRAQLERYAKEHYPNVPEVIRLPHVQAFMRDIEDAARTLIDRMRRAAGTEEREAETIGRRKLNAAFHTLCMDPPRRGEKINLASVRSQKRRLVQLYHPDASGGENTAGAYQAVIEAYDVIEEFDRQQRGEHVQAKAQVR